MVMRIWDGVTDPFVGYMVDKTNGRFGKNRPFMILGNVILAVTSFVMFHVTHLLPEGARFIFFIVVACVYYLGYTCQCVVTKSAQSCLANDPKQRPLFVSFGAVYNTVLFAGLAIVAANLALGALWLFGDPTTMNSNPATGAFHWGYFLILHLVLTIIQGGFQGISGNIVIPMTAGLVFAACGFTDHNPVMGDVATPQLRLGVVFLAYGIIILGLICNLIAMKFYPLTKEKMAELQNEIVAIKERTMAENQA